MKNSKTPAVQARFNMKEFSFIFLSYSSLFIATSHELRAGSLMIRYEK